MHPATWQFYTVVYSLVILLCCMISANGDTDTHIDSSPSPHIDSNSDIHKILMGGQNERRAETSNSKLPVKMNAGTINFNASSTVSDSEPNKPEYTTEINNVREDNYTVTEGIDYKKLEDKPIKTVRDDYTLIHDMGYYKLHKTRLSWNEARKACIAENAHLTVVNSQEKELALRHLMQENAPDEHLVYIGSQSIFAESSFCGADALQELDRVGYYMNGYAHDEVNVENGKRDCVVLHKYRTINELPCSIEYYFICEIPL